MSEWLEALRERWTCWRKGHDFFDGPCCILTVKGQEQGPLYMCKCCGITESRAALQSKALNGDT